MTSDRALGSTLNCLCTTVRGGSRDGFAHREPSPRCPVHAEARPYLHMLVCKGCGCEMPPHLAATHPERCGKAPNGILSTPEHDR